MRARIKKVAETIVAATTPTDQRDSVNWRAKVVTVVRILEKFAKQESRRVQGRLEDEVDSLKRQLKART